MNNNNMNGSFKTKKVYFSQVSNHALRDKKLTLQAKGLYSLIQSFITIENFILYKDMLIRQSNVGKYAFNSAWKELKDTGYLLQERHSDGFGKFYYIYDLIDEPLKNTKSSPYTDFPCTVDPCTDNWGDSNNTYYNNTDLNNTNNLHFLKDTENEYVIEYLRIMNSSGYTHKRVSEENLTFILGIIETLVLEDIGIDNWIDTVEDYFDNLPKDNDGDILAFLKGCKRHFGVDLD